MRMINEKCGYFKLLKIACDDCVRYNNGICDIAEIIGNGEKYFLKGNKQHLKELGIDINEKGNYNND